MSSEFTGWIQFSRRSAYHLALHQILHLHNNRNKWMNEMTWKRNSFHEQLWRSWWREDDEGESVSGEITLFQDMNTIYSLPFMDFPSLAFTFMSIESNDLLPWYIATSFLFLELYSFAYSLLSNDLNSWFTQLVSLEVFVQSHKCLLLCSFPKWVCPFSLIFLGLKSIVVVFAIAFTKLVLFQWATEPNICSQLSFQLLISRRILPFFWK